MIAVPYKEGSHVPSKWADFIPIIEQLQELHKLGYVHGDIRGFNVVFADDKGGLIDFDFSGKPKDKKKYPPGYRKRLSDGIRKGDGDVTSRHNKLQFWHDWYALGRLIFHIFKIKHPSNAASQPVDYLKRMNEWTAISEPPSQKKIDELIDFLKNLDRAGFSVEPDDNFQDDLDAMNKSIVTKKGATGSPLKM